MSRRVSLGRYNRFRFITVGKNGGNMVRAFISALMSTLLVGCGTLTTPEPTAVPSLTSSPTPLPTLTPLPTAQASPAPRVYIVEADGFTVSVPIEMTYDLTGGSVGVFDATGTLIVSFIRTGYDGSANSLQDVIDKFLDELESRGAEFNPGEATPITVGGGSGIAVDLTGTLFDAPIEGRAVVVNPHEDSVLFGLGVSNLTTDPDLWKNSGADIFQSLIDSIQFIEVQTGGGTCPISEDKTYGYTESNPIRVGGDWLDGPARERAYLDNLLGPNGEALSYERKGSFPSGDTILDEYRVTGSGIEVTLYLDEYKFEPLQAPVGFTCISSFPLAAP
jgi:hypothetical protein